MRQTLEAGSIQVRPMGRTWPMTAKIFDKPVCRLTEDILDAHAVCRPAGYRATRFLLKKSTCPRPTGFIRRFGKNRQR